MTGKGPMAGTGVVAMLDVLGARNLDETGSSSLLSAMDELLDEMESGWEQTKLKNPRPEQAHLPSPGAALFGDTVVYYWDSQPLLGYLTSQRGDDMQGSPGNIEHVSIWLSAFLAMGYLRPIIYEGLERGLPLRGIVAYGSYVVDAQKKRNVVIGPAVADAAAWYEKPDWIGISTCPSLTVTLRRNYALLRAMEAGMPFAMYYDVPLVDGRVFPSYCLGWPLEYANEEENTSYDITPRVGIDRFWKQVHSRNLVRPGTETKYLNTERFVAAFFEHNAGFLRYFGIA